MDNVGDIKNLSILTFETSSREYRYLVAFGERFWEITAAVADLIKAFQQGGSLENATELFSKSRGRSYSPEEVMHLADIYIAPIFKENSSKTTKSFLLRLNILTARQVAVCSDKMKCLFQRSVLYPLLFVIIISEVLFFIKQDIVTKIFDIKFMDIVGLIALYIISSFFHELGHASACKYFKVEHGGIGLGLYLTFPVFFTDVTKIWALPRKQRVVVNFAGVYFQLIFLLPLILLSFIIPNDFFIYFVFVINLNFLLTMNPFFKFDGYWMMSDLLGIPNLRKRTNELLSYWIKKIRKKNAGSYPFLLTIKPVEKTIAIVYTIVVNVFFGYYFFFIIPHFLVAFVSDFPYLFQRVINSLIVGKMPDYVLLKSFFSQLLILGLILFFFYNLLKPLLNNLKRKYIEKNQR